MLWQKIVRSNVPFFQKNPKFAFFAPWCLFGGKLARAAKPLYCTKTILLVNCDPWKDHVIVAYFIPAIESVFLSIRIQHCAKWFLIVLPRIPYFDRDRMYASFVSLVLLPLVRNFLWGHLFLCSFAQSLLKSIRDLLYSRGPSVSRQPPRPENKL